MKPLSHRQISFLRSVRAQGCSVTRLRSANQVTLWSLLYRGLLYRANDEVFLTQAGVDVLEEYASSRMPLRQRHADLSERCVHLLKASRVLQMKKRRVA